MFQKNPRISLKSLRDTEELGRLREPDSGPHPPFSDYLSFYLFALFFAIKGSWLQRTLKATELNNPRIPKESEFPLWLSG